MEKKISAQPIISSTDHAQNYPKNKLKHSCLLANIIHITTIRHVIKDTKLPILAKYSIIYALKCQEKPGEQDPNSKSHVKLSTPYV